MNKIYIVAGERNMRLAQSEGGLWANVGQTTRNVYERLRDDDYKRKAAGGKWMVLFEQDVGDMTTDKQIHPLLKNHPDVSWDAESHNTEEFFFKRDTGDGAIARQIVSDVLQQFCLPVLQQENARLKNEINDAQEEIEKKEKIIKLLASGEMVHRAYERLAETEKECQDIKLENTRLQQEKTASIRPQTGRPHQRYEEEKQAHARVKSELDVLKRDAQNKRQPADNSTSMWIWTIPLALLSYFGGCTRAENKWEDTPWKDATPAQVIEYTAYTSDLVEQNSRLKTKIQELTAEKDKVKSVPHDPSITVKVPARRATRRTPHVASTPAPLEATAQVKAGPIETVFALSSCTALNYDGNGEIQCETADSIIRVKGSDLYKCEGRKISFKTIGGSIIASCNGGIYGSHRGTVTITQ